MLEFNLLPWRESLRARNKRHFLRTLLCLSLGVALLSGGAGYVVRQSLAARQLHNDELRRQLAALEPALAELRALHERDAELARRMAVLRTLEEQRSHDALLLDALARVVPDGAYYTALTRVGAELRLDGMASGVELAGLMRMLETSPPFAAPELRDVAAPKADARGRFTLSVPLRGMREGAP
jgi:type IV pilus assembly protein PilN